MNKGAAILRWLLLAGAVYFFAITIVHMFRIKIPFLFVYYNLPSYGYQDRIISFLSLGWSVFLFMASTDPMKNRNAVKAILISGLVSIFGLSVINSITNFQALSPDVRPTMFWREVLGLSIYEAALILFYFLAKAEHTNR
jgi:hypothetical protein